MIRVKPGILKNPKLQKNIEPKIKKMNLFFVTLSDDTKIN